MSGSDGGGASCQTEEKKVSGAVSKLQLKDLLPAVDEDQQFDDSQNQVVQEPSEKKKSMKGKKKAGPKRGRMFSGDGAEQESKEAVIKNKKK